MLLRGFEFSDIISRKGEKQAISECPGMNYLFHHQRTRGKQSQDGPAGARWKTESHWSCALLRGRHTF